MKAQIILDRVATATIVVEVLLMLLAIFLGIDILMK